MSVYKTAGCQASLCFTVWLSDSWCDKHLYIYSDASQPQSSPVSRRSDSLKLSSRKWLIVCCKDCECCWVYMGLPQCAHHEHICFDLGLKLSGWDMKGSVPLPLPFMAIFCLTCLSKSMWIQQASLLFVLTVSDRIVQGQNPPTTHTQTHTSTSFALQSKQISALMMTPAMDERTRKRDKDTTSIETPSKVSRAPKRKQRKNSLFPFCLLRTFEAFLVAHLRKTSVPPHDAEPCVSFCL